MALPIRQNLDLLTGVNRTQRAVLLLVVELAENGGKGRCDATNDYLCKRTQATARTVTRALAQLQQMGLLLASGSTSRRQLVASETLRACYISGTKEACAAATETLGKTLSIDKKAIDEPEMSIDIQGVAIDKVGQCLETNEVVAIDIQPSRVIGDEQDEQLTNNNEQELASLRSALADAQKKIGDLETELVTVTKHRDLLGKKANGYVEELTALKISAEASHTGGPADVPTRKARKPVLLLTGPLGSLLNPGGLADAVQGLKKPFTQAQADQLVSDHGAAAATEIVQAMANHARLGSYVSSYLTANNWLSKRKTTNAPPHASPFRTTAPANGVAARLQIQQPDAAAGWGYPAGNRSPAPAGTAREGF